ncbi:MAG: hypothetical protein IRZ00_06145 [Gemmatimonadetes bacterium]|nr:hypothetical protein [Gemmatimonadota bacterium]
MSTEARSGPHPSSDPAPESVPLGQRLFDNWALLLVAGVLIMALIYTGWGLWEVATMPPATLP